MSFLQFIIFLKNSDMSTSLLVYLFISEIEHVKPNPKPWIHLASEGQV